MASTRAITPSFAVPKLREAAEQAAIQALDAYWYGADVPVDPIQIARAMSVEVFAAQLGSDVFGLLVGTGKSARIFIDEDQPSNRYRFTAAHELGHYADRTARADFVAEGGDIGFVDRRSDQDSGSRDEVFANHFAGALLMPKWAMNEFAESDASDWTAARVMGVSLDAYRYRKFLLGL